MRANDETESMGTAGSTKIDTGTEAADRPAPWRQNASTGSDGATEAPRTSGHGFGAFPTLTKAGANLAQAAMQVGRTGTPEQVQQAVDIIDEARRKLYAILAEG